MTVTTEFPEFEVTLLFTNMLVTVALADLSLLQGHLKPFGQGRQSPDPIDEIAGFPTPKEFFVKYVFENKPLLMRGAAMFSPSFHLWTDDYFRSRLESRKFTVQVESGKKENRSSGLFQTTFSNFLEIYNESDIYLVSSVPLYLRNDILFPCPLQNSIMLQQHTFSIVMWFSSGGTKSVVHDDSLENINCLHRGDKQVILINRNKYPNSTFLHPHKGYSDVDVDRVDYQAYPWAAEVEYQTVNLTAGDCFYIPYKWVHQVNSRGSNLAVNTWFSSLSSEKISAMAGQFLRHCDARIRASDAALWMDLQDQFLNTIERSAILTFQETSDKVMHYVKKEVKDEERLKIVASNLWKVLPAVDRNNDNVITYTEIEEYNLIFSDLMASAENENPDIDASEETNVKSEKENSELVVIVGRVDFDTTSNTSSDTCPARSDVTSGKEEDDESVLDLV